VQYVYSSAIDYAGEKGLLDIVLILLLATRYNRAAARKEDLKDFAQHETNDKKTNRITITKTNNLLNTNFL